MPFRKGKLKQFVSNCICESYKVHNILGKEVSISAAAHRKFCQDFRSPACSFLG